MPLMNHQLAQYPRANVLSIYAIQAECPNCGGLCQSFGESNEPAVRGLLAMEPTIIPNEFEMDLVECVRCEKKFSLPEDAFIK